MYKTENIYDTLIFPWGKAQTFYHGQKKLQVDVCWTLDFQSQKSWIHIPECTENQYTY